MSTDTHPPRRYGILDLPDRPFPLALDEPLPSIRTLYDRARRQSWDPDADIPWHLADSGGYTDEQLDAARVYWSRRAWSEYGAISESPSMQLRFALENRAPDLSLFWTVRTQEEVKHAEVCRRMAEALGRYHLQPSDEELEAIAGALGTRERVLDESILLEATIAGLVCVAETVVYDVFVKLVRQVIDPVAKEIFRLIIRDETRHCEFGWAYLEDRVPRMTASERSECEQAMIAMIDDVELAGYRSAWLAVEPTASEVRIDELVFEAGLGGTRADWEAPIIVTSIRGIRERAGRIGLELPTFHHHLLGDI
ncbi:MAG: ferritin-like domain-containing protein [Acidimicrobiia bacterium]|nr:ferritin-like domain-containing protein [Acidimicrobiia bacterium]